jgi:hypothetical protein
MTCAGCGGEEHLSADCLGRGPIEIVEAYTAAGPTNQTPFARPTSWSGTSNIPNPSSPTVVVERTAFLEDNLVFPPGNFNSAPAPPSRDLAPLGAFLELPRREARAGYERVRASDYGISSEAQRAGISPRNHWLPPPSCGLICPC